MVVSQVEPTLKQYENYLPPLNSHRTQYGPLNSFDDVYKWMQLTDPMLRTVENVAILNSCEL